MRCIERRHRAPVAIAVSRGRHRCVVRHCEATPRQIVVTARDRARDWAVLVMDTAPAAQRPRLASGRGACFRESHKWGEHVFDGRLRRFECWTEECGILGLLA